VKAFCLVHGDFHNFLLKKMRFFNQDKKIESV